MFGLVTYWHNGICLINNSLISQYRASTWYQYYTVYFILIILFVFSYFMHAPTLHGRHDFLHLTPREKDGTGKKNLVKNVMTEPKMTEPKWRPDLPAIEPLVTTNTGQPIDFHTE